jgi:hypothetical protein
MIDLSGIYRIVVGGLVAAILLAILSLVALRIAGIDPPPALAELAKLAIASLGALLAPSPLQPKAQSS